MKSKKYLKLNKKCKFIGHKLFEKLGKNYNPYYLNLIFFHIRLITEFEVFVYPLDQNIVLECLLN